MTNESSQLVLEDPTVSNRHLRLYSIVYDTKFEALVYVEDMSSNGTYWVFSDGKYWNELRIGRGHRTLLSDGDKIRLSPTTSFTFRSSAAVQSDQLSSVQKLEKEVSFSLTSCFLG